MFPQEAVLFFLPFHISKKSPVCFFTNPHLLYTCSSSLPEFLLYLKKTQTQTNREKTRKIGTFFAKIARPTLDPWLAGEVIKVCSWCGEPTIFKNSLFKVEQYKCKCSKRHKEGCQGSLPWLGSLCVKEERKSMGLHAFSL